MTRLRPLHARVRRGAALLLILLVAAILRLHAIGQESLWSDESLSYVIARLPIGQLVGRVIDWEQIPPAHHLLLHFWIKLFGHSEASLRMPSALAGIAGVGMTYVLARRLMGRRTGLYAAALLAVLPVHIEYSREARSYALHVLAGLICFDLFVRLIRRPTNRLHAAYVIAAAVFFYTHIFAVFALLAQHLWYALMLRRHGGDLPLRPREWAIDSIAVAALISPWVPVVWGWTKLVQTSFWVKQATLDDITRAYWTFAGSTIALLAMAALSVVAFWRWRRRSGFLMLLALLIVPVVLPVLVSVLRRPFFAPRYALPAAVAFVIVVAAGVAALRPAPLRWLVATALLLFIPLGDAADNPKPQWREAGEFLEQSMAFNDLAVIHRRAGTRLYDYYVNRPDVRRLGFDAHTLPMTYPLEPPGRRAWLVLHDPIYSPSTMIQRAGLGIGRHKLLRGVLVMELIDDRVTPPATQARIQIARPAGASASAASPPSTATPAPTPSP